MRIFSSARKLVVLLLSVNYLLGKGGYVFGSFGLSVCLSVENITHKMDWDEILWRGPG